ncbi:MAG: alanine:cation symporter family protein, partial [Deltaproteobacteria bacterium]|nr:alanine:cation symporter family protein [Deltaproteobacteria bacterium]
LNGHQVRIILACTAIESIAIFMGLIFCVMHFLGAIYSLELVWAFGDMALGLMTIPNLLSILLLTGVVKTWVKKYVAEGKMDPPEW